MFFETLPNGERARRYKSLYIVKSGYVYFAYDNYELMLEDIAEEEAAEKKARCFNRLQFGQYFLACRKLSALLSEIDKIPMYSN